MISPSILLMRHGHTPENEQDILIGHSNPHLSHLGHENIEAGALLLYKTEIAPMLAHALQARKKVKIVLARPDLYRTIETSDICVQVFSQQKADNLSCVQLPPNAQLRERSFGDFELQKGKVLKAAWTHAYKTALPLGGAALWNIPRAPSVETDGQLLQRVTPAILSSYELAKAKIGDDLGLLLVCNHGSVMRTLHANIHGGDPGTVNNGTYRPFTLTEIQTLQQKLASATIS